MSTIRDVKRPAETLYPIDSVIAGRWSSRAIDPEQPVEQAQVLRLLEAARWAPSSFNNQPWKFLVLTKDDPRALKQGRAALMAGNAWALNAPVLMFSMAKVHFRGKSRENWRKGFETGMAAISMAFQAVHEGLVLHQMAGFSADELRNAFGISEEYDIYTAIAVGVPGREDLLEEQKRAAEHEERTRLEPDALFSWNGWSE